MQDNIFEFIIILSLHIIYIQHAGFKRDEIFKCRRHKAASKNKLAVIVIDVPNQINHYFATKKYTVAAASPEHS